MQLIIMKESPILLVLYLETEIYHIHTTFVTPL